MSNLKKTLFFILSNVFLFFLIEIIFTLFFVFHKSNYYGPFARLFLTEKNIPGKTIKYDVQYSKKTGMLMPGEYYYNDILYKVNKFGFIGEEVDIENKLL